MFFLSSLSRSFSTSDPYLSPNNTSLKLMWVTYSRGLKYLYRLVFVNHTKSYYVVLTAYPLFHRAYYYYNNIFINIEKRILVYRNVDSVDKLLLFSKCV